MSTANRRTKLSKTIDSTLLSQVDQCTQERGTTNRSRIIGEALRLWLARERERAIEAQHTAPRSAEEATEYDSWWAIRVHAAGRLFRRR
jgi:Arc/MetJ-type ribon-helix-helix transcriptional regulator